MGGIGQVLSCLEAEIFLLADLAILAIWKFVSDEMNSGVTAYTKLDNLTVFFSQSVCMSAAGGEKEQLVVVEEEEVHWTLYFCNRWQWRGWGILQWLSKELWDIKVCANSSKTATGCSCQHWRLLFGYCERRHGAMIDCFLNVFPMCPFFRHQLSHERGILGPTMLISQQKICGNTTVETTIVGL